MSNELIGLLGIIAGVMIAVMMLLAVLDVVMRSVFAAPIIGATEIIQILNVGIVVALGAGTVANQHVTVDFVMDKMPKAPRFYIQLAVDVLNIAILVLLAVCSFQFMDKSQAQGYTYSLLKIPEWPFVGLIAIGLLGGVVGVGTAGGKLPQNVPGHVQGYSSSDYQAGRQTS